MPYDVPNCPSSISRHFQLIYDISPCFDIVWIAQVLRDSDQLVLQ